jgi:hypothetical protein
MGMVLRLSTSGDELNFKAGAEGYCAAVKKRAKRIKQWTFYKRDEASIKKVKQMIVERV